MPDFILRSLRGGLNNSDPAIAIADDQCVTAHNVEWVDSMLGDRRRGTSAITLPASLSGKDRITFAHRHIPGTDDTAAELYLLGVTSTTTVVLSRKTTSWSDVTISDTPLLTGTGQYTWRAVSLHGKLFFFFDSDQDRLHVLDSGSTTMRRVGVGTPSAPTLADTGSGTLTGLRYYRVRMTTQSGGVTIRRSEPSASASITPSGSGSAVRVTKPTTVEDSTHWEVEASKDDVNFYVIATTAVGTTTVDDDQDYATGYAVDFDLSEDVGDYTVPWSAKYGVADEDRLVFGGSFEDSTKAAMVGWTPVFNADGVGNDERYELDTDPVVSLDNLDGGGLTGLSRAAAGEIWAFKFDRIYKLVRTGLRKRAYDVVCMDKTRGALDGSVVTAVDQNGRPCVYFLDPAVGPCRAGAGPIMQCGADIRETWARISLEATKRVSSVIYYPATRQVIWNIAVDSGNVPSLAIVLQTNETRVSISDPTNQGGIHRGWSTWDGPRASALAMCLFSTNIEAGAARNRTLVPFVAGEFTGLCHLTDTGSDDNGTAYAAQIRTKPYVLRSLVHKFGVQMGVVLAKAVTGAKVLVKVIRDFGLETIPSAGIEVTFDATSTETDVIKLVDNLKGAELRTAQIDFSDTATAGTRFELNQLALVEEDQQKGNGR